MMSLFSSFDTLFFSWSILIMAMLSMNLLSVSYGASFFVKVLMKMKLFFDMFFLSLKPKSYAKIILNFFFSLVVLLIFLNFFSVLSFNFPLNSQVSAVLLISLSFWFSLTVFSLINNMKGFLTHCIPEGTPIYLVWFLFVVELISNLIRPVTLTVRLVANIVAGHLLMILLSNLVLNSIPSAIILYIALNLVEMFVALIQSYIFVTMLSLYHSEVS